MTQFYPMQSEWPEQWFDEDDILQYVPDYKKMRGNADPNTPLAWQEDPYAVMGHMGMGFKIPPMMVSHDMLRRMADQDVVVASVHETITTLVCNFLRRPRHKFDIGFKIKHKGKKPEEYSTHDENRIRQIEEWFLKCGYDDGDMRRDNLRKFGRKLVDNALTYDAVSFEVTQRRDGSPHMMRHVPGETIRLIPPPNPQGYVDPKSQETRPAYAQVYQERIVQAWPEKLLFYDMLRPRTAQWGYGYGKPALETLINTVAAHLWAEQWNVNIFKNGSTIPGIINFQGNPGKQKLNSFRRQWLMTASGVSNAHKVIVTNTPGVDWTPLNWSNTEMGFDNWLAYLTELICSVYKVPPELVDLSLKRRQGGSKGRDDDVTNEKITFAKAKFLRPILFFLEDAFNSDKVLGSIDGRYKFEFYGIDPKDEEKDTNLRNQEVQSYRTVNEIRAERGEEPLEYGDIPLNPVYTGFMNQQIAMEQADKQQQMQQDAMAQGGGGQENTPHTSQGRAAPSNRAALQQEETQQVSLFDTEKSVASAPISKVGTEDLSQYDWR